MRQLQLRLGISTTDLVLHLLLLAQDLDCQSIVKSVGLNP